MQYDVLDTDRKSLILLWFNCESPGDQRTVAIAERAYGIAAENVDVRDTFGWAVLAAGDAANNTSYTLRTSGNTV